MKSFRQYIAEAHLHEAKKHNRRGKGGKFIRKETGFEKGVTATLTAGALAGLIAIGRATDPSHPKQQEPTNIVNRLGVPKQAESEDEKEPTVVTTPAAAPVENHFENEHIKRLYGALVSAEHRGHVKDPYAYDPKLYIRTRAGGGVSSAYGPLQITRNLARAYKDPLNDYHNQFDMQGTKMLKAKNDDPTYGLGKPGHLSDEEYHDDYQKLGVHLMKKKAQELGIDITKPLNDTDLYRFTQHWRHGESSGKKPEAWYTKTVNDFYRNN